MEGTKTKLYDSIVLDLGSEVDIFLSEQMLVIFNDTVPAEFMDIAVIHMQAPFLDDVKVGDYLEVGGDVFQLTFVGDKANETLRDLGHCTISFNGANVADLPGTICVEKKPIPQIQVGSKISFFRTK